MQSTTSDMTSITSAMTVYHICHAGVRVTNLHDPLACVNVNGDELVDQEPALRLHPNPDVFGNLVHKRPALRLQPQHDQTKQKWL